MGIVGTVLINLPYKTATWTQDGSFWTTLITGTVEAIHSGNMTLLAASNNSKVGEIKVNKAGTVTVTANMVANDTNPLAYAAFYKNGTIVSRWWNGGNGSTKRMSIDLSVVPGDLIQLYGYSSHGSKQMLMSDFAIYIASETTNDVKSLTAPVVTV